MILSSIMSLYSMNSRWQIVVRLSVAMLALYACFVGFIWWAMRQPPEMFGRVMARIPAPAVFILAPFETLWTRARGGTLLPGDVAPDFTLAKVDKSGSVQLFSLTARQPVVLIFGSYT